MRRKNLKNIYKLVEQIQEELPVEKAFLHDLKYSIEMTANSSSGLPSKTYKPSSMNCIRNMYYQMIGAPVEVGKVSASSDGIAKSGTDIHIRIQQSIENMKNNGIDCEYIDVADFIQQRGLDHLEVRSKNGMETKLYDKKLNVSFMSDGVVRYKGVYFIIEIKTETSFKWNNRTTYDPKHEMQGTAYSVELQLPDVIFLYISRDILDMKAYKFTPTQEMKDNFVNKISTCDEYVLKNVCPPKPVSLPKGQCTYCAYQNQCRKDGD